MPRHARLKSDNGLYHIILRGINRQTIFEEDIDKEKFLLVLHKYKEISGYQIYAYCLMSNHVHLLLKVGEEALEQIMRRICGSYVYWYNQKYARIGNLFQDRFKSEPVEDEAYFLTAFRYIHYNPFKAGLVKNLELYRWSSYQFYSQIQNDTLGLLETDLVMKIFDNDPKKALKSFKEFHQKENDDACLEMEENCRLNDYKATEIIKSLFKVNSGMELQKFDLQRRDACLRRVKNDYHLSSRQIERITGISRKIIDKI
jgi:REP element-mobilizing transposase RayT